MSNGSDTSSTSPKDSALLGRIVRQYAWCRVPAPADDPTPWYHLAVDLPDGRRFWRGWIGTRDSDEFMLDFARFEEIHTGCFLSQFEPDQLNRHWSLWKPL